MNREHKNNEDTFLAGWLEGKLSDEQLKALVSEADFKACQLLKSTLDASEIRQPDIERNFAATKAKLAAKPNANRPKVLPLYRYAAIAAMLVLLFGLYQLLAFSNTFATGFGKSAAVALKDGSKVTLNSRSELSWPALFQYNRTLKLKGEAYFEVAKGRTFTVKTTEGSVQVMGTKFNVSVLPDFFEVICLEGKVKVTHNGKTEILTRGDAVRFCGNGRETWREILQPKPLWTTGESAFRNVPFYYVIGKLKDRYHCEIAWPKRLEQTRFTGSFTHKNLETALKSVCIPLNLKYTDAGSGKIILSE